MKERPILFKGEMVRAILEGRKTQTRRVIKPQLEKMMATGGTLQGWMGDHWHGYKNHYGWPGDRLWVKETHVFELYEDEPISKNGHPILYYKGDGTEFDEPYWLYPHYRATDPTPDLVYEYDEDDDGEPKCKWRPSIFMPRWASRITLEIVNIRVERIKDLTLPDLFAEGVQTFDHEFVPFWNSINAKRGFGWDVNPWVWVIEFKRITP